MQTTFNLEDYFIKMENFQNLVSLSMMNSVTSFVAYIKSFPDYIAAKNYLTSEPKIYSPRVIDRLYALAKIETDPNRLHPYDLTMASYLMLLNEVQPYFVKDAIKKIRDLKLNNLWWTISMIQYIETELSLNQPLIYNSFDTNEVNRIVYESGDIKNKTRVQDPIVITESI